MLISTKIRAAQGWLAGERGILPAKCQSIKELWSLNFA
jgi:hypothetical protein